MKNFTNVSREDLMLEAASLGLTFTKKATKSQLIDKINQYYDYNTTEAEAGAEQNCAAEHTTFEQETETPGWGAHNANYLDAYEKLKQQEEQEISVEQETIQPAAKPEKQLTKPTPDAAAQDNDNYDRALVYIREYAAAHPNDSVPRADSKSESILAMLMGFSGMSFYKIAKTMNTYYSVVDGVAVRYVHIVKSYK
jgi:hypothetical protein